VTQPAPPDPAHRRYTERAFPLYHFVPGQFPHPRCHPDGHSYGQSEPAIDPRTLAPAKWRENETYLYGIDLYNYAYWWECHEELEAIWHAAQDNHQQAEFLKGIIQVAAANLRRFMDPAGGGLSLYHKAMRHLKVVSGLYMGVFAQDVRSYFNGDAERPATIDLQFD